MNESLRDRIQTAFRGSLSLPSGVEPNLRAALEHVLSNPGSLVRPEMVLQTAGTYGLPDAAGLELAIALEYFHTASLLFDDLPSMDDASERRGAPCVHMLFGESVAMLAALALINRAYALTWRAVAAGEPTRRAAALTYLESHLGVDGLLNGQSLDLHYGSLPHDQRTIEQTALGKTVSLVRLTLVLPALLAGGPQAELQLLERIAVFWGLSYQIVDDLKDVLQSAEESGKTASRDGSLDRPNSALVLGIAGATRRLERLLALGERTLLRLTTQRPQAGFLEQLRVQLTREAAQLTQAVGNAA